MVQRGVEAADGVAAGGAGSVNGPFCPQPASNKAANKEPTAHSLMGRAATLNFRFRMR
jgi:hypothetical protein